MSSDARFDMTAWNDGAGPSGVDVAVSAGKKRKRSLAKQAAASSSSSPSRDKQEEQEEDEEDEEEASDGFSGADEAGHQSDPLNAASSHRTVQPLTPAELEAYEKKERRKGLIYISRIPRGMTPSKVRHLLSQFGDVSRLFLQDGSAAAGGGGGGAATSKGKKKGKHVSANYTEGWVEFEDKRVARGTAELLNAQSIGVAMGSCFGGGGGGAKKGGLGHSKRRWRDEVWTMRYLPGFKWNRLSEQLANERASHKSRLQAELSQSATEQRDYLKKVERARVQRSKAERQAARLQAQRTDRAESTSDPTSALAPGPAGAGAGAGAGSAGRSMDKEASTLPLSNHARGKEQSRQHTFKQRQALSTPTSNSTSRSTTHSNEPSQPFSNPQRSAKLPRKGSTENAQRTRLDSDHAALQQVLGQIF